MQLSPTMKILETCTEVPKVLLKIIGQFTGTDHCLKKGDEYLCHVRNPCTVHVAYAAFPFHTRCRDTQVVRRYSVVSTTACTIKAIHIENIYLMCFSENSSVYSITTGSGSNEPQLLYPTMRHDFHTQDVITNFMNAATPLEHIDEIKRPRFLTFMLSLDDYTTIGIAFNLFQDMMNLFHI